MRDSLPLAALYAAAVAHAVEIVQTLFALLCLYLACPSQTVSGRHCYGAVAGLSANDVQQQFFAEYCLVLDIKSNLHSIV